MKKLSIILILILIPCFLQAQPKTVTVGGNLMIDSLRLGKVSDTVLVINNGEVKKSVPIGLFIIAHLRDFEIMNMESPINGLLVYNLDLRKLFIFNGDNWEMVNSLLKIE